MSIRPLFAALLSDKKGATAIEYGLIIGVLSLTIITAASNLLNGTGTLWVFLQNNLSAVW